MEVLLRASYVLFQSKGKLWNTYSINSQFGAGLKWYYDQKISSFFPSDFESVFTYRLTGKILSFEFYPKAVFF